VTPGDEGTMLLVAAPGTGARVVTIADFLLA
jgi:hypothetical protein